MNRAKVLFQGSHVAARGRRHDPPELLPVAEAVASALGHSLIRNGLDIVLTGFRSLDALLGKAALKTCEELGIDPRERIRTYPYGARRDNTSGFGMVLEPLEERYQELRTFVIRESDGVVAVAGGKGTADSVQKAMLAKKPVFPIPIAGGAAATEWNRLRKLGHSNLAKGDLDFLGDRSLTPQALADAVARHCASLFRSPSTQFSRRIFVVHGHDVGLRSEMARFLEQLELEPIVLHEQPDKGATLFAKLQAELSDVGYAFVLMSPDDKGCAEHDKKAKPRARQNVIFEHGILIGALGATRVCAVVKGTLELPSDLHGVVYKTIPPGGSIQSIAIDLVRELVSAGYAINPERFWAHKHSG